MSHCAYPTDTEGINVHTGLLPEESLAELNA